jgi:23S rRNA (uridine2552-2'-O)-methyltransferase
MSRYRPQDAFFHKAKREGYRARSALKLEEILRRWELLRPGGDALDLGAAPGGFLQVLARAAGPHGRVVGADLVPIDPVGRNVDLLRLDLFAADALDRLRAAHPRPFDLVTSDMAPKTTGVHATDVARSLALAERAVQVADAVLRPGGALVIKVFMGAGFDGFVKGLRAGYAEVKVTRPEATRGASREAYVVARGFAGA